MTSHEFKAAYAKATYTKAAYNGGILMVTAE